MKIAISFRKINLTSFAILLGLVFLFAGNGSSLNLADNYLFFLIAIIIGFVEIALGGFRYPVRNIYLVSFLVGLLFWSLISGLISPYGDPGTVKTMLMYPVLLLVVLGTKQSEADIKLIEHGVIISSCVFSILVLFFGSNYLSSTSGKYTYIQTFGNHIIFEPNYLAFFVSLGFELAIILLLSNIKDKGKVIYNYIYIIISIVTLVAMFSTGARMTVVAALLFGITYISFVSNAKLKKRVIIVIIILLFLLTLAINTGILPDTMVARLFHQSYLDGSNAKRLTDWKYGIFAMFRNPFGYGPSVTTSIIQNLYGFHGDAHNTFITFGIYYGFIGFIALLGIYIYTLILVLKNKDYGYFSLLISMFFQANVLASQCTITFWMMLLLCFIKICFVYSNGTTLLFEKKLTNDEFSEDGI